MIYHGIDGIAKFMSWRNVTPVMTMIPVYRPPLPTIDNTRLILLENTRLTLQDNTRLTLLENNRLTLLKSTRLTLDNTRLSA